jgi:hypothetical protein
MRTFGFKREEVTANRENNSNLQSGLSTVPLGGRIRRLRWVGHVARMGRSEIHTRFRSQNMKRRDNLEDLVVDGRII